MFGNRTEPVPVKELYSLFADARQSAIQSFQVQRQIRERYEEYETFLDKLQNFILDQEDKLRRINEDLAADYNQEVA